MMLARRHISMLRAVVAATVIGSFVLSAPSFAQEVATRGARVSTQAEDASQAFVQAEFEAQLRALGVVHEEGARDSVQLRVESSDGYAGVLEVVRPPVPVARRELQCACPGPEFLGQAAVAAVEMLERSDEEAPREAAAASGSEAREARQPVVRASDEPARAVSVPLSSLPPRVLPPRIGPLGIAGFTLVGLGVAGAIVGGALSTRPPDIRGEPGEVETRDWQFPGRATAIVCGLVGVVVGGMMAFIDLNHRHYERSKLQRRAGFGRAGLRF